MRSLAAMLALCACSHQLVTVHPVEVAHAAGKLHEQGTTTLMMTRDPIDPELHTLAMRDTVEVKLAPGNDAPVRVAVADLMKDCPPFGFELDDDTRAAYPRCMLFAVMPRRIVVTEHRAVAPAVKTVAVLGALGGLVVCTVECPTPWNYVTGGTLALAGVAVIAGMGLMLYALTKMRD
jgi:hypothetical protein